MTRFVKNLEGIVHSVIDEFVLPRGWEEASEADASPALLGKEDPDNVVTAVADHDGGGPVVDVPSTGTVGIPSDRRIDADTSLPKTVFPDGKAEEYPNGTDHDALATPVGGTAPVEEQPADEGGPVDDHAPADTETENTTQEAAQ